MENEISEPKVKQQSGREFVAKQPEDQKESDGQKEARRERLSTIDSTNRHLQPQVPLPSPGTPTPGGGTPSSASGNFMQGMTGTWVYASRNELDVDDWL